MATAAFATDSENTLDNKVDPDAPNTAPVAPNDVPVVSSDPATAGPTASGGTPATAPTQATGEASTSSADAQKSPTGAGPSASGGTPAPASNIPGPGSQPAGTPPGPGSQPATAPAAGPTGTAPTASGQQVTENANGSSNVTPQAGTTLAPPPTNNSQFTSTTVGGQNRDKTRDEETGGKVYNPWAAESSYHRDASGNIATNENLAGPETYVAHTSVRSSGEGGGFIVDYTKFGPDGTPMSPAEDVAGWNTLTQEQQEAAMRDYLSNLEEWEKKQPGAKPQLGGGLDPEFFDPEKWRDMPPEARKEAVEAWLEGKKTERTEADAKDPSKNLDLPLITKNPDGSVSYRATDSKGNVLNPWDDVETWKSLTPEQRSSLVQQAQDNAKIVASGGVPGEDQDYLGSGMPESKFKSLSPEDQGWVFQNPGWDAPQHNADQSTTYTEKAAEGQNGAHSYTLDHDGFKTSESWPAGVFGAEPVTFTYGKDGISGTMVSGDITITRDSQGNDVMEDTKNGWVWTTTNGKSVLSAKEGSPAAEQLAMGYHQDGHKMTPAERFASNLGVRVEDLTEDQIKTLNTGISSFAYSQEGYSNGKATGLLALKTGLISQEEFDAINSSNRAESSWGAWLAQNPDVVRALNNAGVTDEDLGRVIQENGIRMPRSMSTDPYVSADYFINMQNDLGRTGMIPADALSGVNPMYMLYE